MTENWEALPAPPAAPPGPCCRLMEQSRNGWRVLAHVSDSLLKDSREWIGELEQERDTLRARLAEAEAERDRLDSECRRVAVENLETHLRQRAVIDRLKAAVRSEHERGDRLEALVERAGGSWHDRWEQAAKERDTLRARLAEAEAERDALRSAFCDADAAALIAGGRYAVDTCLHCQGVMAEAERDRARGWAKRWKALARGAIEAKRIMTMCRDMEYEAAQQYQQERDSLRARVDWAERHARELMALREENRTLWARVEAYENQAKSAPVSAGESNHTTREAEGQISAS